VPHAADVILEAWGPTRVGCVEEAVRGLVEIFADVGDARPTDRVPVALHPTDDEDLLVLALEEVVYVVEVAGVVPVGVHLAEHADGEVSGHFDTVPTDRIQGNGAVPKGVSHSDLVLEARGDQWWCRAVVDV